MTKADKSRKLVAALIEVYEKEGYPSFLEKLSFFKPLLTGEDHQFALTYVTRKQESTGDREATKQKLKDVSSLLKENSGDGGGFAL